MLARRLIRIAIAYFAIGISLGMFMGIQQDFRLAHVHSHLNLLGWVALALIGLAYRAFPVLERGWLPQAHFWLHNLGLPLFMGGFALSVIGGTKHIAPIAIGSSLVALGVALLTVHVLLALRKPEIPV